MFSEMWLSLWASVSEVPSKSNLFSHHLPFLEVD